MSIAAKNSLFSGASIGAVRADNATLSRLRECAVYDVCIAGIDRAFLALLASENFSSMRAAFLARVSAFGQPLGALHSSALIACNVDSTQLHLCPLAGDTTVVLVFRLKCYSQRAARDLSDMLLLHYDKHQFAGLPSEQYWGTPYITFAASSVRVPRFRPRQAARFPTSEQRSPPLCPRLV